MFCVQQVQERWSKSYNFGGLGKCMEDGSAAKLQECLLVRQDTGNSRFKLANDRIRVLMAKAHDIFAADICIIKNAISLIWPKSEKNDIVKKNLRSWTNEKNVKCV